MKELSANMKNSWGLEVLERKPKTEVFGARLFLLLSLSVFSTMSGTAYIVLALISVTISFRVYNGVIQAIQKSDEGHPLGAYLDSEGAVSRELSSCYL
uniref:Reticulon domain-containing protein n=1 Tax=Vombatus ursinus TaxID=29139 RepID=A0A4X2M6C9_VOMUR